MSNDALTSALLTASIMDSANASRMEKQTLEQRSQALSDMYGMKPPAFDDYRQKTGKTTKIGKMLLSAVAGAALTAGAVALLIGTAPAAIGTLVVSGIIGAFIGGSVSSENDHNRALTDYNTFVTDFATAARGQHEAKIRQQTIAAVQEAVTDKGQTKNWVASVEQSKEAAKSGGRA